MLNSIIATLDSLPEFTKFNATNNLSSKKVRCMKENSDYIFVYAKGKKRYGYRFGKENFAKNFTPAIPTIEEESAKWHKRIKRVLKEIDRTGLWKGSEMEKMFRNLLKVSLKDKKDIYRIYCENHHYENGHMVIDDTMMKPYMEKYPFMFQKTREDELMALPEYSYIGELSECNLKSMYFGLSNTFRKDMIKDHISARENLSFREFANYDVSFEMRFDKNDNIPRAWYSEEYKGCANGHYYLAVSESCAIFCEDD